MSTWLASGKVPPGGSTVISIELKAAGGWRENRVGVIIHSNDPGCPMTSIQVLYRIERENNFDPQQLFFGRIPKEHLPKTLRLFYSSGKDVAKRITSDRGVSSTLPFVDLNYPADDSDKGISIDVVVGRNSPIGNIEGEVLITHGDSVTKVPLFGYIRGDVFATPEVLSVQGGSPGRIGFRITPRTTNDIIKIECVRLPPSLRGFEADFDSSPGGTRQVWLRNTGNDRMLLSGSASPALVEVTVSFPFREDKDNSEVIAVPLFRSDATRVQGSDTSGH